MLSDNEYDIIFDFISVLLCLNIVKVKRGGGAHWVNYDGLVRYWRKQK